MSHANLFNFILYNFLQMENFKYVLVMHCWQTESLLRFAQMANTECLYTQYLDLNGNQSLMEHFPEQLLKHNQTKIGVYLDINCKHSSDVLETANEEGLYTPRYHWLLYDQTASLSSIRQYFEQAKLLLNTDLTYVEPIEINDDQSTFLLYDLYNKGQHLGARLNITIDREIACNISKCHLHRYKSDLYSRSHLQHRKALNSLALRVSGVITTLPVDAPLSQLFTFLETKNDIHIDLLARFSYQLREVLKNMLGCDFAYIFRNRWGSQDIAGGVIGDLLNDTADLAMVPFAFTPSRVPHFQALTEFCSFRSACMFRTPFDSGMRLDIYLEPFSLTVWLLFAALLLLMAMQLWYTFRVEQDTMSPSLLNSCLLSFGAACMQGAWLIPNSLGGRIAFIVLMLMSFLMSNFYTSIVVSNLLGPPVPSKIRTMQQLADSNLEVGVDPIPFTRVYVQTSDRPDIRNLYSNKLHQSNRPQSRIWPEPEQGVQLMRIYPGYVYIGETAVAYEFVRKYFKGHEICELNEIPLRPESVTHTLVAKGSSYGELFKLSELRLMETGIRRKHESFWVRQKLSCDKSSAEVVVRLNYVAPLLIMLLGAYILCLAILAVELAWHRARSALSRRH